MADELLARHDLLSQLAEATGCHELSTDDASWCEVHTADWPCQAGIAARIAQSYAATELLAMADRLTKAHDLGPARRLRNRANDLLRPL